MKHIFLATILTQSFVIKAMDMPHKAANQGMIIHSEKLQLVYSKTFHTLCELKSNKKNPLNIENLISVINQIDILKSAQPPITEKEIGFLIYTKKLTPDFGDYLKGHFQPTINPVLVSLFFVRLKEYNEAIKQQNISSPNAEQMANYLHELYIKKLAHQAREHNLIIPQTTINEITIPTTTSCAVEEFKKLMNDISAIFKYGNSKSERLARLLYHEELKNTAPLT